MCPGKAAIRHEKSATHAVRTDGTPRTRTRVGKLIGEVEVTGLGGLDSRRGPMPFPKGFGLRGCSHVDFTTEVRLCRVCSCACAA